MSIKTLIRNSSIKEDEVVSTSLRISSQWNIFIENLAEYLDLSKHAVMLKLLEEGIEIAKVELQLDEVDEVAGDFHLLNTNKQHSIEEHNRMMNEGIATALYTPWKNNIPQIKKSDVVFLFENGRGIVAYGRATGELIKEDYRGEKDARYLQKLNDFSILKKPLTAASIKRILGRNVVFMRTRVPLPDGQLLLDEILK